MSKDNSWGSRENRTDASPKSPPVNFINITRRPEGGIVNIEMSRQPGSRPETESTSGSMAGDKFFRTTQMPSLGSSMSSTMKAFDDPFFKNENFGINSLMRKHQQKFDNFGYGERARSSDSNQSSLVINPPPRPIQVEKQASGGAGSPYRVVIHPRSQSSDNVVVESSSDDAGTVTTTRHIISPKSGSTGNVSVLETKFPSLRSNSPFGQRSFLIQSPLFGDGSTRLSLFDRYNEHAPPSFFRSNPDNIHVSKVTVMRDGPQRPRVHNIPIKIEGRDSSSHQKPSVVYKIPINLVNRNSESKSSQPPLPAQVTGKPKGVTIPIITHRTHPSEAEEKLAQLTKQLEEEMKLTGATKQQQQMRQQIHQQQERDSIKQLEIQKQQQLHQQQQPKIQNQQSQPQQQAQFTSIQQQQTYPREPHNSTTIEVPTKSLKTDLSSDLKQDLNKKRDPFKEDSTDLKETELLTDKASEGTKIETVIKPTANLIKDQLPEKVKEDKIMRDLHEKEFKEDEKEEDYMFGSCYSCEKEVLSDACLILGRLYHCRCFLCSVCDRMMKGSMYYDINGVLFCEQDYLKSGYSQVAEMCMACHHVIKHFLVQGAGGKYHRDCFKCYRCSSNLESQPFTLDSKNNLLCLDDYYELCSPKCFSCQKCIKPPKEGEDVQKVMVQDKTLHVDCYKCQDCNKQLGYKIDDGCYPYNNILLLCKNCSLIRER